jgi:hypothetical protein
VITVGGSSALAADLEAAINIGDTVTYQAAAATPATKASVSLTNGPVSGTPFSIDDVTKLLTVEFDTNGPASDTIDYTDADDPNIVAFAGIAGNATVQYNVGATTDATIVQFEAAVNGATALGGTLTLSDSGTVTIWTITSP